MKVTNLEITDISKIDLPAVLYKYRDWTNDLHKTIITKREVYMSSPLDFPDEHDCKIPIRYDLLSYDEIENKVKIDNPDWPRQRIRKFLRDWNKNKKDEVMRMQELSIKEFCKRMGVLSLTEIPDNEKMWEEYAANSTGFCIGFNPKIMFKHLGGGHKVEYHDELPIIYPTPKHEIEVQHYYQVYSKLKKFKFEKEYRTKIFSIDPLSTEQRKIILPPEAYKEIIFGKNIPDEIREEIIQNIPEELGHIILAN